MPGTRACRTEASCQRGRRRSWMCRPSPISGCAPGSPPRLPRQCSRRCSAPLWAASSPSRSGSSWRSTPNWPLTMTPSAPFPRPRSRPGSRRGGRIRSRNGSPAARSKTSRSAAVSKRSIPRCATRGAPWGITTPRGFSTGGTMTGRGPRCASSTVSWARPTCSTASSSHCRGFSAPATTWPCSPCPSTVAGLKSILPSADTATSRMACRDSPRRWPKPYTTSAR